MRVLYWVQLKVEPESRDLVYTVYLGGVITGSRRKESGRNWIEMEEKANEKYLHGYCGHKGLSP